jgi:hypothetical protein
LAAAMGGAFSIQTFFIPVLRRNPNQKNYAFFTLLAYIAGSIVYFYIAYAGAEGKKFNIQEFCKEFLLYLIQRQYSNIFQ